MSFKLFDVISVEENNTIEDFKISASEYLANEELSLVTMEAMEEVEKLNVVGFNLIREVFEEIPLIGKTKKEREEYIKTIEKIIKQSQENQEVISEEIEEKK